LTLKSKLNKSAKNRMQFNILMLDCKRSRQRSGV